MYDNTVCESTLVGRIHTVILTLFVLIIIIFCNNFEMPSYIISCLEYVPTISVDVVLLHTNTLPYYGIKDENFVKLMCSIFLTYAQILPSINKLLKGLKVYRIRTDNYHIEYKTNRYTPTMKYAA